MTADESIPAAAVAAPQKTGGGGPASFGTSAVQTLLCVYLFANPFPHVTAVKEISFYLSVTIAIYLIAARKIGFAFKTPLALPFALFVAWSCIGLFFALNRPNTFHDLYAHLLKYMILYYLLVNFFLHEKSLKLLVSTVVLSTMAYSVWMILYFYLLSGNSMTVKLGLYMDEIPSNIVAITTLFGTICGFYLCSREAIPWRKWLFLFATAASATATLATQSRGALLAMFAAVVLSAARNRKQVLVFILCILLLVSALPVKYRLLPGSLIDKVRFDDRTHIWYTFVEMLKDHPIAGIGFGMQTYYDVDLLNKYNARVPEKYRQPVPHKAPHNLLVDIAVRTGIVGFVLFLFIFLRFLRMGYQLSRGKSTEQEKDWALCFLASFAAVFIQGMFENTLSGPPAVILYALFALMTISWRLQERRAGSGKVPSA